MHRSKHQNGRRKTQVADRDAPRGKQFTEPVVYQVTKSSTCSKCQEELWRGQMVKLVGDGNERAALCKICAGLGELFYVPAGDANLTRRISKYSTQKHVVLRWSNTRNRYERQGLLVELEALNKAETELGQPLTIDRDSEQNQPPEL